MLHPHYCLCHFLCCRDVALACFPRHASILQATTVATSAAATSPETTRLMSATRQAARSTTQTLQVAVQLAAAFPTDLAAITHAILPVESNERADATPRLAPGPVRAQPGEGFDEYLRTQRRAGLPTVSGDLTGVQVPSGYGPPLPQPLGQWGGVGNSKILGVPQFTGGNTFYALGVSNATTMLNSINAFPLAFMLPCSATFDANSDLASVSFANASQAAACAGQLTVSWSEVYANDSSLPGPRKSLKVVPKPAGTCREAVERSGGLLPSDTCDKIRQSLDKQTNVTSDIGNDTLIYTYSPLDAGVTTYVGLAGVVAELQLAATIPEPWRSFGALKYAYMKRITMAGANTPSDLRKLYNVPKRRLHSAQGLLAAPALFVPCSNYDISPADLSTANDALGAPVPAVQDVTNPPAMPANIPALVYTGAGCEAEAALDIQQLTQFGAGSGATYGFAAASNDTAYYALNMTQTMT